jgi:hypothetical protein
MLFLIHILIHVKIHVIWVIFQINIHANLVISHVRHVMIRHFKTV